MTDTMSPHNVDSHMPPVVPESDRLDEVPQFEPVWNPATNEWEPGLHPHSAVTLDDPSRNQQPTHGDVLTAHPMVNDPGDPRTYDDGSATPDGRMNLLDAVRSPMQAAAPPIQIVRHVVETNEVANCLVRARLIVVTGNINPTTLLEENSNRDRALISVFTAASTILFAPLRQGGSPQLLAAPTTPGAFFPWATADGTFEIKSSAGVECYGVSAGGVVLVRVWEELKGNKNDMPGLV